MSSHAFDTYAASTSDATIIRPLITGPSLACIATAQLAFVAAHWPSGDLCDDLCGAHVRAVRGVRGVRGDGLNDLSGGPPGVPPGGPPGGEGALVDLWLEGIAVQVTIEEVVDIGGCNGSKRISERISLRTAVGVGVQDMAVYGDMAETLGGDPLSIPGEGSHRSDRSDRSGRSVIALGSISASGQVAPPTTAQCIARQPRHHLLPPTPLTPPIPPTGSSPPCPPCSGPTPPSIDFMMTVIHPVVAQPSWAPVARGGTAPRAAKQHRTGRADSYAIPTDPCIPTAMMITLQPIRIYIDMDTLAHATAFFTPPPQLLRTVYTPSTPAARTR